MDALLDLLQRDAFMPREDIARQLDLTVDDVEARIAELEKAGVILGYQAVVNRDRLEENGVIAVIEVRIVPERDGGFDRIARRIAKFEEVQSCYLVSGGYDLMVIVEAQSLRGVATFVAEKLSTIGSIQSTATRFRLKTYKENGVYHEMEAMPERLAVSP